MLGFAVVLAITAVSMGIRLSWLRGSFGRCRLLPKKRVGSRSGAQYRPRADLLPWPGALLCGDRQGRRRQSGPERPSQPERRDRAVDEGHHEPGRARPDHAPCQGIQRLHQDFCRYPQGQGRERAGRAEPARPRRKHAEVQIRRAFGQRRRSRASGRRARHQAGDRAISGDDGARQHVRRQFRPGRCHQRAGAAQIRRELAACDLDNRQTRSRRDSRKPPGCWRNTSKPSASWSKIPNRSTNSTTRDDRFGEPRS